MIEHHGGLSIRQKVAPRNRWWEGELRTWLVGGALAICLSMILGLLGYILWMGLPIFWPRPIALVAESEEHPLLGQRVSRSGQTVTFATGNLDIGRVAYRELEISVLESSFAVEPESAVVVERLEWGNLLGLPLYLYEDLRAAMLLDREVTKLRDLREAAATAAEGLPADQASQVERFVKAIDVEIRETWDAKLRGQLGHNASDVEQLYQTAENDAWRRYDSTASPGDFTVAAQRRWHSPKSIWGALTRQLRQTKAELDEIDRLRASMEKIDARLALEQKGLRALVSEQANLESALDLREYQRILIDSLAVEREAEQNTLFAKRIRELPEWESESQQSGSRLFPEMFASTLRDRSAAIQERLEVWRQEQGPLFLATAEALKEYGETYKSLVRDRNPLEARMRLLQRKIERRKLKLAVLSSSEFDVDQTLVDQVQTLRDSRKGDLDSRSTEGPQSRQTEFADGILLTELEVEDGVPALILSIPIDESTNTKNVLREEARFVHVRVTSVEVPLTNVVRVVPANRLNNFGKARVYFDRWAEFLCASPRDANTSGGMFPAICGTVVLILIMTVAVVPLGAMAALYLREYTSPGPFVSLIRISINNLAGVPSIVYGVFSVAFFCYTMGAFLDGVRRTLTSSRCRLDSGSSYLVPPLAWAPAPSI